MWWDKYLLSELIRLQCRKTLEQNVHLDQEHVEPGDLVDEVNGHNHVVDEENVGEMKKHDHQGSHEEDGDKNQVQMNLDKDGDDNNMNGEDQNSKMDHHVDGGLPVISDSVFSIIIMVCIVKHVSYRLPLSWQTLM